MNARIVVYRDLLTVCLEVEPKVEDDGVWVVHEAKKEVRISKRAAEEIAANSEQDLNAMVILNLCEDTLVWCGKPVQFVSSDMVYTDGVEGYTEVEDDLPEWAKAIVDEDIDTFEEILEYTDEEWVNAMMVDSSDDPYGDPHLPQHAVIDDE